MTRNKMTVFIDLFADIYLCDNTESYDDYTPNLPLMPSAP